MKLIVNIDVADQAQGEAFYTAALGLRVGRRWDGMVELLGLDAPIYLLQKDSGSSIGPDGGGTRGYDRHWTPVHLDIAVDDLDAAAARARRGRGSGRRDARCRMGADRDVRRPVRARLLPAAVQGARL